MKTVSRNKLFHCFRPMVDVDVVIEPTTIIDHRSADLSFAYLTAENHVNDVKVSGSGCSISSEKNSKIVRKPAGKRTFSRAVKAVFFETILAKRVRDRKGFSTKERPSLDLGTSTTYQPNQPTNSAPANGIVQEINTNVNTCSPSSSRSAPESIISSRTNLSVSVKKSNKNRKEKPRSRNINTGLYFLLISLAMTVLWGRLCAILFTSIWLCFLPLSYSGNRGQEKAKKSPEIKKEGHKWKGLVVERKHHIEKMKIRPALNF